MKLAECADTFRCVVARKATPAFEQPGPATEGRFFCYDALPTSFDSVSGFLLPDSLLPVSAVFSSGASKYFLRENDILMINIGLAYKVGRVALFTHDRDCVLPGRSFVVIRAARDRIDPVWLYYYLRQTAVREHLVAGKEEEVTRRLKQIYESDGVPPGYRPTSVVTLHARDLRNIEIKRIGPGEVEAVNERHNAILQCYKSRLAAQMQLIELEKGMAEFFGD